MEFFIIVTLFSILSMIVIINVYKMEILSRKIADNRTDILKKKYREYGSVAILFSLLNFMVASAFLYFSKTAAVVVFFIAVSLLLTAGIYAVDGGRELGFF